MSKKLNSTFKNCRTYNSAKIGRNRVRSLSCHCKLSYEKTKHITKKPPKRYDTDKLQNEETSKKCASIIGDGFANLLDEDDEITLDELFYIKLQKSYIQQLKKKSDTNCYIYIYIYIRL